MILQSFPRTHLVRAAALFSFTLSGAALAAPCPQAADVVTCHYGETPDPIYAAPAVTTIIMEGGNSNLQTLEFEALRLENFVAPSAALTFTTTGFVRQASATAAPTLLDLYNQDGSILATLGADTRIAAASQNIALDLAASSVDPGAQSRLALDGVLMMDYVPDPGLTGAYVVGIRNRTFGTADSNTILGAGSLLSVTSSATAPTTLPTGLFGVYAQSADGDVRITSRGTVSVVASSGLQAGRFDSIGAGLAAVASNGNATIDVAATSSVTVDNRAYSLGPLSPVSAVRASVDSGGGLATINLDGQVETFGNYTSAVEARSTGSGDVVVVSTAGSQVRTQGIDAFGVFGSTAGGGTGNVQLRTADITTTGDGAVAVTGYAATGSVTIDGTAGAVQTSGADAIGVYAEAQGTASVTSGAVATAADRTDALHVLTHGGSIDVHVQGAVQAGGVAARALYADSFDAPAGSGAIAVQVAGSLQATQRDAAAAVLRASAADLDLQVAAGASVRGGWNAAPTDVDATTGFGAAGVILRNDTTRTASVTSLGTIGARSDFALDAAQAGALAFVNGGTLNGYFTTGAGNDAVTNNGSLNLRHLSDGNGAGDTKRIATVDFGAGDDVLRNEAAGTLRVSSVPTFATASTARQFLPDLMPVASFSVSTPGVEQVHLTRLERFENRGTLTLRDMDAGGSMPVAGDVLLMTSGTVSDAGVLTPGAAPMVFLADGGTLALDTVLNEGGAASHSDMLVVDSVQLGPNGPTRIVITNAGGLGAATSGAGIKLVDVLGGGALSAAGAFVLGAPVVAGAFTYNLFRSAPLGTDGDWYLRTAPAVTPPEPPVVPPPTNPPTNPPPTNPPPVTYRPEAALFASIPGFLRNVDAAIPGSRQARLGDEDGLTVARRGRLWARYISQDIDSAQTGTVAPIVKGDTRGYQAGVELYGGRDEAAAQIGLYTGQMQATADVRGFANGVVGTPVGRLEPRVTFAGLYVSRSRGQGFYFDTVLQYGFYDGEASTFADGEVAKIKGTGGYASLETGYGFRTSPWLVVEPQFQVVAQPQHLHDVVIVNADVAHKPANTLAGRAGVRLRGEFGAAMRFQPYVGFSLWQGLDHQDETRFSGNGVTQTTLETNSQLQAFEFNGGFSLGMGSRLRAFAEYGRLTSRGGAGIERSGTSLSAGLRFAW